MRAASADGVGAPTDQLVARATDRSLVAEIMGRAKLWFAHKPSVELAQIIGCDVRTCERYFAGERTPAAGVVFAMLRSEVGVKLIEEATRDFPAKEHQRFWHEMAMAVVRADLRKRINGP